MLSALLLLLACAPTEDEVVAALVAGDLAPALASDTPWAAEAAALRDLEAARRSRHPAELGWTLSQAHAALNEDRLEDALVAMGSGLRLCDTLGADAAPFTALGHTLLERCPDHGCRARVHAALSEAHRRDAWLEHRRLAFESAARDRNVAGGNAATTCAGVDRDMAREALTLAAREYLTEPDPAVFLGGAVGRLQLLADDPEVSAHLGVSGLDLGEPTAVTVDEAVILAVDAVSQAVDAGMPEPIASCEAVYGALNALDPYSLPVWPSQIAQWQDHHAGVVLGVGLRLLVAEDGGIVVDYPVLGSSAFAADVHRGDRVVRIVTADQRLEVEALPPARRAAAVAAALEGPPGTPLDVRLLRDGEPLDVTLERSPVPMVLLSGLARDADNRWTWWLDEDAALLYVRIESFKERSDDELVALLSEIDAPAGVLLDLRGNKGGDMGAAIDIADLWIDGGVLVEMVGRGAPPPPADGLVAWNMGLSGQPLEGTPVVVLTDHATASAAEILSGALQERAGAIVVGGHTWGKGMAQGLRTHPSGFALQITNGQFTLPSGRPLDRAGTPYGVEPDVLVPVTPLEELQADLHHLEAGRLRSHADGSPVVFDAPPLDLAGMPVVEADVQRAWGEVVLRALVGVGRSD